MKRYKQRLAGLLMALGLATVLPAAADEVVATAAGGWFAVDSRAVKDTTLQGGVIVGGATNVVVQSSPDAWGEAGGGVSAMITCQSAKGSVTVVEATTAGEVSWTPEARSGVNTLTYTSGSVQKTAQFVAADQVGDEAYARVMDGTCTISGTGDTWNAQEWPDGTNPLAVWKKAITNVVVASGVTSVGEAMLYKFYAVTNATLAASVTNVAGHAFYNCHSLQGITFEGATPTFGEQAVKFTAAIRMNGETPEVYTIPNVASPSRKVWAKDKLTDKDWTDVTGKTDAERGAYHFFKVVVE